MSSTVIRTGDGAESFLASGVPYLEFDRLPFQINSFNLLQIHNALNVYYLTKSTPIVLIKDSVYVSSANRSSKQDLPTPESPIKSNLNK